MRLGNKNLVAAAALLGSALLLCASIPVPQSVLLEWSPSPSSDVVGYHVYYGAASGTYTNMVDVGNTTNATITGLAIGVTYYFAVTAYNSYGLESAYSNQASYTIAPVVYPTVQISFALGQLTLTGRGQAGTNYNILGSPDLTNWSVIGSTTADTNGTLRFTNAAETSLAKYFYRLQHR